MKDIGIWNKTVYDKLLTWVKNNEEKVSVEGNDNG